jgi:hypothetical protein
MLNAKLLVHHVTSWLEKVNVLFEFFWNIFYTEKNCARYYHQCTFIDLRIK